MRAISTFTTCLLLASASACALAQGAAPAEPDPALQPAPPGSERTTQRIEVEDQGSRVQELRVGGETQSISVQPKVGTLPEYEVRPADATPHRANDREGAAAGTGPRVWNLMRF